MKAKNKRDYILIILGCIMLFFGVGYSALYQKFEIIGFAKFMKDFKVVITDVEFDEVEKGKNSFLTYTDDTVTFNFILEDYSDAVEYLIKVENKGNIDATLKSVVSEADPEAEWIDYELSVLNDKKEDTGTVIGTDLISSKFHYIKIVMKVKSDAAIKPNKGTIKFKINYIQK